MSRQSPATLKLDATFSALADPTRRAILSRLVDGQATVGELARGSRISAPSFSRHLKVLEQAGLIARQADAQWRRCRLEPLGLRAAFDWLQGYEQMWSGQLDKLADYVDELNAQEKRQRDSGRQDNRRKAVRERRKPRR